MIRCAPLAAVVVLAAACARQPSHPAPVGAGRSSPRPAAARTASPDLRLAWQPDAAAATTARAYATEALSYRWDEGADGWISRVAALCTPQWRAELLAASRGGGADWAAVVARHQTTTADIGALYPAHGPGPGRRIVVTATVHSTGDQPAGEPAVVVVDLLPATDGAGGWLVGWAQ